MTSVARLKVTLDEVEPKVARRLEVPVTMRLSRLHTVLQIVLGWTDSHLDTRNNRDFGGAMIRFVVDGVSGAIWVG